MKIIDIQAPKHCSVIRTFEYFILSCLLAIPLCSYVLSLMY